MKPTKYSGLFIWAVVITSEGRKAKLWIVTKTDSINAASTRAMLFLKGNQEYPKAKVTKIKQRGFIDA